LTASLGSKVTGIDALGESAEDPTAEPNQGKTECDARRPPRRAECIEQR